MLAGVRGRAQPSPFTQPLRLLASAETRRESCAWVGAPVAQAWPITPPGHLRNIFHAVDICCIYMLHSNCIQLRYVVWLGVKPVLMLVRTTKLPQICQCCTYVIISDLQFRQKQEHGVTSQLTNFEGLKLNKNNTRFLR